MKARALIPGLVTLLLVAVCVEPTKPRAKPSVASTGGVLLDKNKVTKLRPFEEGGCAVSAPDSAGTIRGFVVPREHLPFSVPAISRDPHTGQGNGRLTQIVLNRPGDTPVSVNCMMPSTVTSDQLSRVVKATDGKRMKSIFAGLKHARALPDTSPLPTLSPEAQALLAKVQAPRTNALLNQDCQWVKGEFTLWQDDNGNWVLVEFAVYTCNDGGVPDAMTALYYYLIDQLYTEQPLVVVYASNTSITELDTVTFTLSIDSPYHLSLIGWQWTPAYGTYDPWTTVCYSYETTCATAIHGTGTMSFTVEDDYGYDYPSSIKIDAAVPADVGDGPGDVAPPDGWEYLQSNDELEAIHESGLSGPFDASPVAWSTGPISDFQSFQILYEAARNQPQWTYTMGCYLCGVSGPNTERGKDILNHVGDCADFVWTVIKNVLGGSWNHDIMYTAEYDQSTEAHLGVRGFVPIDASSVRRGDVVLRALTSGCHCGHVGIFVGWGADRHPIGWANNGQPAVNPPKGPVAEANQTFRQGRFDFIQKAGTEIKYFRPQTS